MNEKCAEFCVFKEDSQPGRGLYVAMQRGAWLFFSANDATLNATRFDVSGSSARYGQGLVRESQESQSSPSHFCVLRAALDTNLFVLVCNRLVSTKVHLTYFIKALFDRLSFSIFRSFSQKSLDMRTPNKDDPPVCRHLRSETTGVEMAPQPGTKTWSERLRSLKNI